MTSRIDFYLLEKTDDSSRLEFICKLVEKGYKQQLSMYLHAADLQDAKQVDDLLWTYHDTSFIPHGIYQANLANIPLIIIGHEKPPEKIAEVLINLTQEIPMFYRDFNRVIEVVPNNAQWQEKARDRYRYYRSENCELNSHRIA